MKVGKGVLCIATDKNVQIGFIRAFIKKWAPKISTVIDRYLQANSGEISKEIKELFKTDTIGML